MTLQLLKKHQITAPSIQAAINQFPLRSCKAFRNLARTSFLIASLSLLMLSNSANAAESFVSKQNKTSSSDTKLKWRSRSAAKHSKKNVSNSNTSKSNIAKQNQSQNKAQLIGSVANSDSSIKKTANYQQPHNSSQQSVLKRNAPRMLNPAVRTVQRGELELGQPKLQPSQDPPKQDPVVQPQPMDDADELEKRRKEAEGRKQRCKDINGDVDRYIKLIKDQKTTDIPLDISPRKPNKKELERMARASRTWTDEDGNVLFEGYPIDYHVSTDTATFSTKDGNKTAVVGKLNRADQCQFYQIYYIPFEGVLATREFQPRNWTPSTFTWKASALCHHPTYFEQEHLERYGHSPGPIVGPVLSAGHFFATFPILPYKMGLQPPGECVYSLGYYRPGNCAPYMIDPIPLSVRAGLWQAGAWVGGVYLIP